MHIRPETIYSMYQWNPYLKKYIAKLKYVKGVMAPQLVGMGYEERVKILQLPSVKTRGEKGIFL